MSPQLTQNNTGSSPRRIEQIRRELRAERIGCGENFVYFVPGELLDRLITTAVIETGILDTYPSMGAADAQMHAQRIRKSAKKLFAIFALLPYGASIRFLIDTELSDEDLPLLAERVDGRWSLSHKISKQRIEVFDEWDNGDVEEFARTQWWMIPPVFDINNPDCLVLEDDHILPFIPVQKYEKEDDGVPHLKPGGYSEVTAYHIHPENHNFWPWDKSIPLV
jgi:hypothetical protein